MFTVKRSKRYCEDSVLKINGKKANIEDFGYFVDTASYGECCNVIFVLLSGTEIAKNLCEKYKITPHELAEIRGELCEKLMYGNCCLCC